VEAPIGVLWRRLGRGIASKGAGISFTGRIDAPRYGFHAMLKRRVLAKRLTMRSPDD
jgi:hypothetical protein